MFAPIIRSMTFTLGLCSAALCPDLLAETSPDQEPGRTLELGSTNVTAQGLSSTTENTESYTTGAMSTATRLNLSIKERPQSVSVVTRQQMDDFKLGTLSEAMSQTTGVVVQHNDSDRVSYSSRGYTIKNFQVADGRRRSGKSRPVSAVVVMTTTTVIWMSEVHWLSTDACADAACWPIATAIRSATSTSNNVKSATGFLKPI